MTTTNFCKSVNCSVSLSIAVFKFHILENLENGPAVSSQQSATEGWVSLLTELEPETRELISEASTLTMIF